jgi:NADPH:quinone reductase-like Zn-dependent oxidoreductase
MKAAVLHDHGSAPRYGDFDEPVPAEGQVVLDVSAAGLNHLDLLKASGGFYTGPPPLPSVVGSDAVGRLPDGSRVFCDAAALPHGAMAERTLVPADALLEVIDGIDDAVAAALGNSGLGAWLALTWKAELEPGETVLVLGATGAVGTVAVQAAKLLGAGRVIAAARGGERLERLAQRGADALVALDGDGDLADRLRHASGDGVDVVVDPLWGEPALAAMKAAAHGARHVQMGQLAGLEVALPAPLVRASALRLLGFAVFHAPLEVRRRAYAQLTERAARGEITVDIERVPLSDIESAWQRQREGPDTKLVIIPD